MNPLKGLQKILHRFVMIRPVTSFFASRLHRIDKFVLQITGGKLTASQFAGWTIIQLTTVGAKTGKPRTMPLIGVMDGERIAVVASSFGREHNPGWYYNLKANPICNVRLNGGTNEYLASETSGTEYERYWSMAVSIYAGYEKYRERASHRHIPIMVLEPKT